MPTTRPRHQVTETPEVAHALDVAGQQWTDEPRSKLLLRMGSAAIEWEHGDAARRRRTAIETSSGRYADAFRAGHRSELREDWPE